MFAKGGICLVILFISFVVNPQGNGATSEEKSKDDSNQILKSWRPISIHKQMYQSILACPHGKVLVSVGSKSSRNSTRCVPDVVYKDNTNI
jgi:hypothetical protein